MATQNLTPKSIRNATGIDDRVDRAIRAAGLVLVSQWKTTLGQPGRGRTYPRGIRFITAGGRVIAFMDEAEGRSSTHVAAAPGDPAAKDLGDLQNSIDMEVVEPGFVRVGSGSLVALVQEYGVGTAESKVPDHPGHITIPPHPHGRPAGEAAKPPMTQAVLAVLRGR
jgi:hypothetical protein